MKFTVTPDDLNPSADDGFSLIPKGRYRAIVSKATEKETNSGTGRYVELEITIQGPTHEGRKVWDRLNLENPNPKAVAIARKAMTALCLAVGLPSGFDEPSDLCDKMFEVNIAIEKSKDAAFPDKNKVASYVKPEAAAAPGPPRAREAGEDAPW